MVLNDLIRGKLPFFQEPPPPPPPGTTYTKQDLRAHDIKVREAKKDAANAPIGPAAAAAAAAAAMARVGAPVATRVVAGGNEGEEDEEEEEGEEVQTAKVQPAKQKLSKLLCTHRFDSSDMHRGDEELEEEEEEEAFDSDDVSDQEEEDDDEEEEEEEEDEEQEEGEGASGTRKGGAAAEEDDVSGEESDVSLNEGAENSDSEGEGGGGEEEEEEEEEEEDAAAEAAWAEMELQAENGATAGGKVALGDETQKKINRTLLRRRRKALMKDKGERRDPLQKSWAFKIGGKRTRESMLPGMEDHLEPEDSPAYGKRPKPGRHVNKKMRDRNKNRGEDGEGSGKKKRRKREGGFSKEKTGQHFYNAVDVKGKRRRADRPN